jgi:phosphatidylserine/phosphatidylglycerophosphate/cardiolipin synthase-like enzyme
LLHGLALQHEFFTRLNAGLRPDQLRVYTMHRRYLHAKFIQVDDRAFSVGSANANPRGFQLDTELNVLVDAADAARSFRHRLWAHNLGETEPSVAGWTVSSFFARWDAVAAANQKLLAKPEDMVGEGIVPFNPRTLPGARQFIPDVLTEVADDRAS